MLYYPLSALVNAIASTIVCLLAITKNPRSTLNRSFGYFAFSVAFWSYFYFFWQISDNAEAALFWCRVLMAGAIFIPPTFLHFSITFVDKQEKHSKVIKFWYLVSVLFLILDFTPLYMVDVRPRLGFPYWPTAGVAYAPFLAMFIGLTIYAHILMYRGYKKRTGFERNRIKYVFLGTAIGFIGGTTNYPLWYDIPIPPFGNALVAVYVAMVAYATIKYRFMDITVFTVRGLILAAVYFIVIGIPFWVGFKLLGHGPWIFPCIAIAILATAGPFIYNFFRRRAEQVILREQMQYHHNLLQISRGMTRIKELDQLMKLIVRVVSRRVQVKSTSIYLRDKETTIYVLKASRNYKTELMDGVFFDSNNPIVKWFHQRRELKGPLLHTSPLVYEEIKARLKQDKEPKQFEEVESIMRQIDIDVIVPSFVNEVLLGFLALGRKTDGRMYTQEDLNVFSILGNQAALAIENAIFYEETGKTLAEKLQEQRIWSIGKMGAGIGHQINNRFGALSANVEIALLTYLPKLKKLVSDDGAAELIKKIEEALQTVADNAKRGGDIAKTLTNFSRKSDEFKPVDLEDAIKGALNLLSCKFKLEELNLELELPLEKPKIYGNLSMMQDIFFNILDNTHDAEVRKQHEIEERVLKSTIPYASRTVIRAKPNNGYWEIEIEDNGIGMTEDETKKLFIPFFTTKATSEKGTGLGISMMKLMIDAHKGSIKIISKYGEGTKIMLTIPIMKG